VLVDVVQDGFDRCLHLGRRRAAGSRTYWML
jgi:hypothetical protein